MKKREEVDVKETWSIEDLYSSDDEFNLDLEKFSKLTKEFRENYKHFSDSETLKKAIKDYEAIFELYDKVMEFASLSTEVDATNVYNQKRLSNAEKLTSNAMSNIAFFTNELVKTDKSVIDQFLKENSEYEYYINSALKFKKHLLSDDNEELLSKLSPVTNASYGLYSDMKYGDISFGKYASNGKEYEMTYNSFEEYDEYEIDTEKRRDAFKHFSNVLEKYEHSNASIYNNHIQQEKIMSNIRGYDSVIDYLLDKQDISRDVYENHLDIIMEKLSKPMRKYANIIKKFYKLDEMTYADLKLSIDPEFEPEVDIDGAKKIILDGLSIMGDEYTSILERAFDERWIDYSQNYGKRTGAFCASPYLSHSFIMTTYNNKMSQVMTLAHELGHAGHFYYANNNQSILNTDVSMYFVESPSTANEITMERYLLKNMKKDREKLWILSTMISKTYYHNFVTHFIEARFQREVYRRVDKGESLRAEDFNEIFRKELEKFWQDDVNIVYGSEFTWRRQPHYYMGLYPYTYQAGLTIGTNISKKIVDGDKSDRDRWIDVLKLGASKSPMELSKLAGVNMTSTKPIEDTIEFISDIIDQIDILCEKLGMY